MVVTYSGDVSLLFGRKGRIPWNQNKHIALQKHNSFSDDQVFNSDEDDCLCEQCSHIMARVFGKVAVKIESPLSDIDFGPIVEPKKAKG